MFHFQRISKSSSESRCTGKMFFHMEIKRFWSIFDKKMLFNSSKNSCLIKRVAYGFFVIICAI